MKLCNQCYKPLKEHELKHYSVQWQYSGDMYCDKCENRHCPVDTVETTNLTN